MGYDADYALDTCSCIHPGFSDYSFLCMFVMGCSGKYTDQRIRKSRVYLHRFGWQVMGKNEMMMLMKKMLNAILLMIQ